MAGPWDAAVDHFDGGFHPLGERGGVVGRGEVQPEKQGSKSEPNISKKSTYRTVNLIRFFIYIYRYF